MRAPTAIAATNNTPNGTPSPIPILLAFDRPWFWLFCDVGVVVVGCELPVVAEDVGVSVSVVGDDEDSLTKLYEAGAGSSVYLFDTPNRTLVILLP